MRRSVKTSAKGRSSRWAKKPDVFYVSSKLLLQIDLTIWLVNLTSQERDAISIQLALVAPRIHARRISTMNSEACCSLRSAIDLNRDRVGRPEAKTLAVLKTPPAPSTVA